jgi:hypothetical protein
MAAIRVAVGQPLSPPFVAGYIHFGWINGTVQPNIVLFWTTTTHEVDVKYGYISCEQGNEQLKWHSLSQPKYRGASQLGSTYSAATAAVFDGYNHRPRQCTNRQGE